MIYMPKSKLFLGIAPNHLTFFRMAVGLCLPSLILSNHVWMHQAAFALFVLGALSDYWDGWLARRYNMISETGKWIDPLADKVLVLGCLWAFSRSDAIISEWCFWMIFVREVLITFCRTGWQLDGKTIGAEKSGKWKLFFQTFLIGAAFFALFMGDNFFPQKMAQQMNRFWDTLITTLSLIVLLLTWFSGISFLLNNRALFGTHFFSKFVLAAGVGLLPKAPGTWGSVVGVILVALLKGHLALYVVAFFFFAVCAYFFYEQFKNEFEKDPQFFVLDEVCGIFITFLIVGLNWKTVLVGFLLFRIFDISKPYPIRSIQDWPGYWGIMADDLLAGAYAAGVLWLLPL